MEALQLRNVRKRYGDKTAVNGLDLTARRGEIFGLLGSNGAGKTTTMRMVLGILSPDEGEIRYEGKPYHAGLRRRMGYLPEERGLYPKVKVCEQLVYLAELRGMSRKQADRALKDWLERFGIPDYYNRKVEELSKGNQQKIQFIAAVLHDPDWLILDEAFSGLDPVNADLLKRMIVELRDAGKTILFSSHRMDHVEELCDNICILHRSNVVLSGSLRDIKNRYPREWVRLETDRPVAGLDRIPGVLEIVEQKNGWNIRIRSSEVAQEILKTAAAQVFVHRFQLLEPTLHEIFVREVGDPDA
ncbi:MAG: sodium ABC transporter ATP-binding protein [Candidatus Reconcilbacillus cellulovorans]|uniref:Sodium ABC transporter ATP-binding protein n=1 Tax=Candidatus Reconcilbacillus cellulovorans TaxID=1906605 RepID=A0A2A6DX03_9BACL|nr:MAG: sodium ABC transporter ATP-binding protein [Candidatus Reconcilbacillus cellulovorans]